MDILIKIALLIALLGFTYLVFALVMLIRDLRIAVDKAGNSLDTFNTEIKTLAPKISYFIDDMRDLKVKLNDSLSQFDQLQLKTIVSLDDLSHLSKKATVSLDMIESRTEKFIEVLDPIEKLFKVLYNKVFPVLSFSGNFVGAISKGIKVFSSKISN